MKAILRIIAAAGLIGLPTAAFPQPVPADIQRQLPTGFGVMTLAASAENSPHFYFIALKSKTETNPSFPGAAPVRPMLIFSRDSAGHYRLLGRNDHVILRRDEGGANGCDPFEGQRIAVKGSYFTLEQGVGCGEHWTYYLTFRFDPRSKEFVFDNSRGESWSMNPSDDPNAEALISNGQHVVRGKPPFVPFTQWRPRK